MKIMQIASGLDANGATTHCLLLARELAERGHEIVFLCRPESWIGEQADAEGFEVILSDLRRWPADELRRISRLAQGRGIDVLHTHMSRAHSFGVLLRWMAGIPCVATAHSCRVQFHWMFNDLVIAVSERTRRFHESYNLVQPHRIQTIHSFVDDRSIDRLPDEERRQVRASFGAKDEDLLVGIAGPVCPRKGQIHMVHAMPRLLDRAPNARLVLVGDVTAPDYATRIRTDAETLGVAARIVWAGRRDDISRIISAFDVSVSPSLEEDFPQAALEAMAAAVPVVATDVGGAAECVVPGETGFLVPPHNPRALAQAVASLATSPQAREEMAAAGRLRILCSFSARSQTSGIEKALSSVIRPRAYARAA
ncbi:MAG: glycosyltransferase family 4 protein [Planctomycetaceae bacterium]|nr:glycosyltransferase family 4 protein [Planctomycetaceae bacterium]